MLNEAALHLLKPLLEDAVAVPGVVSTTLGNGARVLDSGVSASGGLQAGLLLAQTCLAGQGQVCLIEGRIGESAWPTVQVTTDRPVEACLQSQYAGWRVSVGKYFGMGSGPMRAAAGREELFDRIGGRETATQVVGVLEAGKLPDEEVTAYIAERCRVSPDQVVLLVAPTASLAGTVQVVARSVETALHKLFELGFDVSRVKHGYGTAPLPPVAADDLSGIGLTNDAILYGGQVTLWVTGDDESLRTIGPQVPSSAARGYGDPFLEIFKAAGHDFYRIDPMLFSPARVTFHNLETGRVFPFGEVAPEILRKSFGL